MLGLLGVLMFSPIFGVSAQFHDLVTSLPSYVNQVASWVQSLYTEYESFFDNANVRQWLESAFESLSGWASGVAGASAAGVVAFGSSVANALRRHRLRRRRCVLDAHGAARARPRDVPSRRRGTSRGRADASPHVHARHGRLHQGDGAPSASSSARAVASCSPFSASRTSPLSASSPAS